MIRRPDKPWFGPLRSIGKAIIPVSWEGYAVTVALVLGLGLLKLEPDATRRGIAIGLLVIAYAAVVYLTWDDPDGGGRKGWRETLLNWPTLLFLLLFAALFVGAAYLAANYGCCVRRGLR